MKLLLENWREYLAESDSMDQMEEEFVKYLSDTLEKRIEAWNKVEAEMGSGEDKDTNWKRQQRNAPAAFVPTRRNHPPKGTPMRMSDWNEWNAKKVEMLNKLYYEDAERVFKKLYHKYVDRDFIQNDRVYVHWTIGANWIVGAGDEKKGTKGVGRYLTADRKHQTSAEAYLKGSQLRQHFGKGGTNVGVLIRGHVVIGSNIDMHTFGGYEARPDQKSSGVVKGFGFFQSALANNDFSDAPKIFKELFRTKFTKNLVFDKETFKSLSRWSKNNEFILDNWEAVAIVIPSGRENPSFSAAVKDAQKYNLPMIDENQNPIEMEDSNETPT